MIPISLKPEPANFDASVRIPGQNFLRSNPHPKHNEWKPYWTNALPDLRIAYNEICAYSATWIPHSTGGHSVDHFDSKTINPHLAYEWSNFRYCSSRFNSRKGVKTIADPFSIHYNWFEINFSNMLIQPADYLAPTIKNEINASIDILGLNSDDKLVEERLSYFQYFHNGDISFSYLERKAPFIAYELRRQGLYP
jgi:hypothetical protein